VRRWNKTLKNVFIVMTAVLMFIGMDPAAEAAVYASPMVVWGYPMVAGVVPAVVPMVVAPPVISPVVIGYPWMPGAYYYGTPLAPGYVYSGVGYALPYTAVIIQGK